MAASFTVTLASRRSEVARLHALVHSFGERHGLPEDLLFAIDLALDEIVTNVIVHGYGSGEHRIDVTVRLRHGVLEATVRDDAPPFDPLGVPPIDVEAMAAGGSIGGFGLHLVRSVMDTVEYRRDGARNVVRMTRAIRRPTGSGVPSSS